MFINRIESIEKDQVKSWYKLYYNFFLKIKETSVQSKPYLTEDIFLKYLSDRNILKFTFSLDGVQKNGIIFITDNLMKYPESHYENIYFNNEEILKNVKYYFIIGDLCGLILDESLIKKFNKDKHSFGICLKEILLQIKRSVGHNKEPILVGNFSNKSKNFLGYEFLNNYFDDNVIIHKTIDQEIFVSINFSRFSELLLKIYKYSLKLILSLFLSNSIIIERKNYKLIFNINNKIKIWKTDSLNDQDVDQCLKIYKSRLTNLVLKSPQKLLYDDEIFKSYLKDKDYLKYILEDSEGVGGLFILISKKFKEKANWVSNSNKIYDGYIKLILTRKGVSPLYFSIIFLSSIIDFIGKEAGLKNKKLILADYSININGDRFNNDLGITRTKKFTELLRKNGSINEFLTRFVPYKANILDKDIYVTYRFNG